MQISATDPWLVVINPNAGNGMGRKDWNKIEALLHKYNISFQQRVTEAKHHAIHITIEAIQRGCRK
jgi:diacylglycerol kinase family enzyme